MLKPHARLQGSLKGERCFKIRHCVGEANLSRLKGSGNRVGTSAPGGSPSNFQLFPSRIHGRGAL